MYPFELDLEIQEIHISSDGQVKISYILSLETKNFSGPIGGGQSVAVDQKVLLASQALLDLVKKTCLVELGVAPEQEERLDSLDDEDPL